MWVTPPSQWPSLCHRHNKWKPSRMSRRLWRGPLTHITFQYARNFKCYVSHDYNLQHWRLLLLLWARDEMQGYLWTLGGAAASLAGARRAGVVRYAWRSRAARVRDARVGSRLAGGCGPGGIDAGGGRRRSAAAGRLRRAPPPRAPLASRTRPPARSAADPPPTRRRIPRFNSLFIPDWFTTCSIL